MFRQHTSLNGRFYTILTDHPVAQFGTDISEKLPLFSLGKDVLVIMNEALALSFSTLFDSVHSLQVEVLVKAGHVLGQESGVVVRGVVLVPGKGLVAPQ